MTISSTLASSARRALRAAAHHLDPVVMIGDKGLTAAVLHEIDIALTAHALIKVRVASDDREQRVAFMNEICEKMGCESVQHLGKLLVLWRNKEDGADAMADDDGDQAFEAPASLARGPRKKLASEKDAGFRRPSESDPKPREAREGGRGVGRGAYESRKPAHGERGGGYGRSNDRSGGGGSYAPRGGGGYAPRGGGADRGDSQGNAGGGFKRGDGSGYAGRGSGDTERRSGGAARTQDGAENRRYRRSDEAPPADTRPPREGWAPRGRRGAGRGETNEGFSRDGGQGFAPDGDRRPPRGGSGEGGFSAPRGPRAPVGGPRAPVGGSRAPAGAGRKPAGAGRTPSGEGRWGARGGSAGGAGNSRGSAGAPAAKPRARRRLG